MFAVSSLQDHPWPILLFSLVTVFAQLVDTQERVFAHR
jgi:hypothetical protein